MSEVNKGRGGTQAAREWKLADLLPVLEALQGLRFGSVELFIQDSRLVQIDRREKIRTAKT
jgi:hypothetical protein